MSKLLLVVLVVLAPLLHPCTATASDWWSPQHDYRVALTVDANGHTRTDKPVEVVLNFTVLLGSAGQAGAFDPNSLRVVEVGSSGIADANVPFQFDPAATYHPYTNAAGTLILLLAGNTVAGSARTYQVYFDLQGKGFTAPVFADQTVVSTVSDEGQSSYRVQTANATYFYQNEAGGFSSLHDIDNNDWINYHPTPLNSPSSSYRGIPNMVHPEGKLHPGATGHTTTLMNNGPLKATIHTIVDTDGDTTHQWDVLWEFFPTYARMTVNDVEHDYWFLYEGTPGGDLEPDMDFVVRSNGTKTLASKSWTADLAGEEWAYFGDPGLNRALYLVSHTEDALVDSYKPMSDANGDMTVFAFGRQKTTKFLSQTPAYFTIGLMDTTAYASAAPIVRAAYKPLAITLGNLELISSEGDTTPPVISSIQATVSATTATLTWDTNEAADSEVDYGLTEGYGFNSSTSTLVTSHSITLNNLTPSTLYHYRIRSTDGSGNSGQSEDVTFTTASGGSSGSPSGMVSDEFFDDSLNPSVWSVVDPVGDSTVSVNGSGQLAISVPAGTSHDLWKNALQSPRVRQTANNTDFQIEVKFDSAIDARYQLQGLTVEQDASNLLRFDFNTDGLATRIYSASFINGNPTKRIQQTIMAGVPLYLRVTRTGNLWTEAYSYDGANWVTAGSYSHTLNVTSVSVFAGNAGAPAPAHTTLVDYFTVDNLPPPIDDTTPPVLSDVQVAVTDSMATVTWSTNETADSMVDYGLTSGYGLNSTATALVTSHSIVLASLSPSTLYHYRVGSTDGSGNTGQSADLTFTTASFGGGGSPSGMVSDAFTDGSLNPSVWSVVDPVGDSTVSVNGSGQLVITVPAGTSHDLWKNALLAPRTRQAANNTDFQLEVKFDSALGAQYQLQGLTVEQDATNLLRFDFNSDGSTTRVYSASFVNGIPTKRIQTTITAGTPLYLRVTRQGNQWTLAYSYDGNNWIPAGTYSHTLNVTSVGVFAGNAGASPPAHTALIDYFVVDDLPAP